MDWPRLLAYITGTVGQELLLRNEYLVAENRILKGQIKTRWQLSDAERATLAEIAHRLGRKSLEEIAVSAKPETILGWYRNLIANQFDGSRARRTHGRPRIDEEMESLAVRLAKENPSYVELNIFHIGIKLAFGLTIGFVVVVILIRAFRHVRAYWETYRLVRADCVYQPSERPGAPSGWLIRDITSNDWLLWDEKNRVTLRAADDAPPGERWSVSNETLNQFISLAHQEKAFWSNSEAKVAKQGKHY